MHVTSKPARRPLARSEQGFTMIIAVMVLFLTALLVGAALLGTNSDIKLTHAETIRKKAYYAAQAGISAYQFQLSSNPNYWIKCPSMSKVKVPGTSDEEYTVKTLPASSHSTCESEKQATILESNSTFRIESTGTSNGVSRSIVATFTHPGFIDYVYFSNYEVEDPANFSPEPTECEHYYKYRVEHNLTSECEPIRFIASDKVNGPMHTNDAAAICSGSEGPVFGRTSKDVVEMNEGHYAPSRCSNSPKIVGKYTESGPTLDPPETDSELLETATYKFSGKTIIVLKGSMMKVTVYNSKHEAETSEKAFPTNGVVYVENGKEACAVNYTPFNTKYSQETNCGNVFVSGSYTESLTIAAAGDVVINGSITTSAESSGEPTGGAVLGLIAQNYVRIYHPIKRGEEVFHETPKTEKGIGSKEETCATESKKTGTLTKKSTKVTGLSSTSGLTVGSEVSGSGIPSGDKIARIESSTSIALESAATSSTTTTLTFYVPTGYEYHSGQKLCVAKASKSGLTYHETETLYSESCPSSSEYESNGFCAYTVKATSCPSGASNYSESNDPYKLGGSLENPTIDAAILSTRHSFIVDNYSCGAQLGELTIWGSVAQFWRGPVGTGSGSGTGYVKNYNYDDRLSSEAPPYFLSPSSTSWHLSRETQPPE